MRTRVGGGSAWICDDSVKIPPAVLGARLRLDCLRDGRGPLQLPWSMACLLKFLCAQLSGEGRAHAVQLTSKDLGEAFRADAKAEGGIGVVGGWRCLHGDQPCNARWFSVTLDKESAPWAFRRGEPFRSSAALEWFGTLLCVLCFARAWPVAATGIVKISGTIDNQGNSWILSRLMCTEFPLILILGVLATQLRERNLGLQLEWEPREQNEEADALTNGGFNAFDSKRRSAVGSASLDF